MELRRLEMTGKARGHRRQGRHDRLVNLFFVEHNFLPLLINQESLRSFTTDQQTTENLSPRGNDCRSAKIWIDIAMRI